MAFGFDTRNLADYIAEQEDRYAPQAAPTRQESSSIDAPQPNNAPLFDTNPVLGAPPQKKDPFADFRNFDPSTGDADAVGQDFYNRVSAFPKLYETLNPQEQMQYQYLRYVNGEISGNNKDDQIKKIRQQNDLASERMDGEHRYIIRNKPTAPNRKDGITPGDVFGIGQYTQTDTGKDDGLFSSVINKALPGFDVGDVLDVPGINLLALAAAPYTAGLSTAALEGLKLAEGKDFGIDSALALASPFGSVGGALGMVNQAGELTTAGELLNTGLGGIGGDTSYNDKPSITGSLFSDYLQDVDVNQVLNPQEVAPPYEEQTGPWIGNTPVGDREGWHWVKDILSAGGWRAEKVKPGGGGAGSDTGGGSTEGGGTPSPEGSGEAEEDVWVLQGGVLVNVQTGATQEAGANMEEDVFYNSDGDVVGEAPKESQEQGVEEDDDLFGLPPWLAGTLIAGAQGGGIFGNGPGSNGDGGGGLGGGGTGTTTPGPGDNELGDPLEGPGEGPGEGEGKDGETVREVIKTMGLLDEKSSDLFDYTKLTPSKYAELQPLVDYVARMKQGMI